MKKILIILGAIVVVLIVIVLLLPVFVNANRFRPELESKLTTALGRNVNIGNIELSILSGGVKVDNLEIADDPAFGHAPFLQAKELTVGAALMPLIFSGRIEVHSFTISDPQVSLVRSSSGAWNFSTLGSAKAQSNTPSNSMAENLAIEELKISNGTITIGTSDGRGKPHVYEGVYLDASDVSYSSQFPFKLSLKTPDGGTARIEGKVGPIDANDAALSPLNATISLDNLNLASTGFVDSAAGPSGFLNLNATVSSDGREATLKGSLKASKLKMAAGGSPATVPVNVDYETVYDLTHQNGTLKQADVHIGGAVSHLEGKYDVGGATAVVHLKLDGQEMPVADLGGVLPAAGIALPPGASLKRGSLDLALAVTGPTDKLVIAGPVNLSDGVISGFNLKVKLGALGPFAGLGGGNGSDTDIQKFHADIHVDPAGTNADNLDVVIPSIGTVTGKGTVSPSGQLDFKMVAKLEAKSAVGVMTTGLGTIEGGGKNNGVPFRVIGTTKDPIFLPDVAGMAGGMAKGVVSAPKNAAGAATGLVGGLFGKKKKQ